MVVCLVRWKNGWMEDGQTGWAVWYWLLRGWVTKTSCLCYVSALQGDLSACFSLFYLLFVLWLTDWWRQMFPGFVVLCLNQICINSRKTFHFFSIMLQKCGVAVVIKPSRAGVRTTLLANLINFLLQNYHLKKQMRSNNICSLMCYGPKVRDKQRVVYDPIYEEILSYSTFGKNDYRYSDVGGKIFRCIKEDNSLK